MAKSEDCCRMRKTQFFLNDCGRLRNLRIVAEGIKHIIFEWHNPDIAVQIIWCWWLNVANGIIIALQFMSENFLKDRYKHKQNNSIKISWRKMCNAQTKTSKCYREIYLKLSTDYAHWNHDKGIMYILLVNIPLIYLWLV